MNKTIVKRFALFYTIIKAIFSIMFKLRKNNPASFRFNHTYPADLYTNSDGFTLIELLLAIAIISILSTAVFLTLNPQLLNKKAHDSEQTQEIQEIAKGFDHYLINYERYPTSLEDMSTGIETPVPLPPPSVSAALGASYGFRSVNNIPRTWGYYETSNKYYVYDAACHEFFTTTDNPDTDSFNCKNYTQPPTPPAEPPTLYTVTGYIDVQGRAVDSGVFVVYTKDGTHFSATTASSGKYTLQLASGTYSVSADKELYLQAQTSVTVSGNKTAPLTLLKGGDANGNGQIEDDDMDIIDAIFNKTCASSGWDTRADVNGDCVVNIQDLALAGGNYGLSQPTSW